MMRYRALVEEKRKGCWILQLLEDGTMYLYKNSRWGVDWPRKVPKGTAPSEKLPKYVRQMVMEMRLAHPEVSA